MAPSALERHDLEQDIDELRNSIESLESSRNRLRDAIPEQGAKPTGSIWSDLTEIVSDFFAVAGDAIGGEDDEESGEGEGGGVEAAGRKAKRIISTDWSGPLGDAFGRLRDRLAGDLLSGGNTAAPVAELGGVIGELDSEVSRLKADLERKLDRVAEIDRSIGDTDSITPVHPHHRGANDDTPVIPNTDDIDVHPIPIDVLPDVLPYVDPIPVVPDDDTDADIVLPPVPDIHIPAIDIIPVPDIVTPDVHDDTPPFDPDARVEIGELDGAIYDVAEILAAGKTVADLRKYDVPAGVVKDAGVTAAAMLDGGYLLAELHEADYSAADLHGLASASDLHSAGYTASDLHGIFSAADCIAAFSPRELRDAGFTVSDFHGLVTASDLRDVFSVAELRAVYNIGELRTADFSAADLHEGGFGWEEIASAGFSLADLEAAGANDTALKSLLPNDYAINQHDDT